jgi:hypothetical protein
MADKKILVARLRQIINQRRRRNWRSRSSSTGRDRFDAEAFAHGTEIKPEEQ